MKNNNNVNGLVGVLLVVGVILIIGLIAGAGGSSANTCIKSGCNNTRASRSSYCYIHKPYTSSGSATRSYSTETGGGSTSGTNRSSATSSYLNHGSSGKKSKSTTRTYNSLNNDLEDYDDPEEFADDAWRDDFDDWDEAYDYWEDY